MIASASLLGTRARSVRLVGWTSPASKAVAASPTGELIGQ